MTIEHDPHRLTKSCSDAFSFETAHPEITSRNKSSCDLFKKVDGTTTKPIAEKISPQTKSTDKYTPAERLFIKNIVNNENGGNAYVSGTKTKQLCKNKNLNLNCAISSNSLKDQKERCSSMSKLLDENHPPKPNSEFYDLSRTKSFRVDGPEQTPRIFRASDLVQG